MIARTLAGWGRLLGLGKSRSATEDDRRSWGRLACDVATTCKPTRGQVADELPTRIRNISTGGACLHLSANVPVGELICLSLPGEGDEACQILACVVRSTLIDEGSWEVGCTFASSLSPQELYRFDGSNTDTTPIDRRGWDRYPCAAHALYQIVRAPEPSQSEAATILNISGGGLAIQPQQPLDVGDLLSVDLYRGDEHVVTALASVVRAGRQDGQLVLGCNFIRDLPEEQLARLLH